MGLLGPVSHAHAPRRPPTPALHALGVQRPALPRARRHPVTDDAERLAALPYGAPADPTLDQGPHLRTTSYTTSARSCAWPRVAKPSPAPRSSTVARCVRRPRAARGPVTMAPSASEAPTCTSLSTRWGTYSPRTSVRPTSRIGSTWQRCVRRSRERPEHRYRSGRAARAVDRAGVLGIVDCPAERRAVGRERRGGDVGLRARRRRVDREGVPAHRAREVDRVAVH